MKHQRYMLKLLIYVLLGAISASTYPIDMHQPSTQYKVDKPSTLLDRHQQPWRSNENGEIIAVRITSSVAVARGKKDHDASEEVALRMDLIPSSTRQVTERTTGYTSRARDPYGVSASERHSVTALPPSLAGANIEFIKQLRSKKEGRMQAADEHLHPFRLALGKRNSTHVDSEAQASERQSGVDGGNDDDDDDDVPRARSIQLSPFLNTLQAPDAKVNVTRDRRRNSTTTSVSFNVVHDVPSHPRVYSEPSKVYSEPSKVYSEPAKVYGEPELFYSEPAKVYSEPSKVYGEPAKVYGEPARIYSEPAKIYSEPAKYYSEPASLHLDENGGGVRNWEVTSERFSEGTTGQGLKGPAEQMSLPSTERAPAGGQEPERNYEVDEALSVQTNGRTHGVQPATESATDSKVGYVLEGNEYRKYRVEERTADGFIVGEYGVVSHNDGSLRGVRYTADADTSPRLIYDALMKFLHLT